MGRLDVWVTRPGVPLHTINIAPPEGHTTLYQVLRVTDESKAAPIMNLLVDSAKVTFVSWQSSASQYLLGNPAQCCGGFQEDIHS